jgi:hypothetical protein
MGSQPSEPSNFTSEPNGKNPAKPDTRLSDANLLPSQMGRDKNFTINPRDQSNINMNPSQEFKVNFVLNNNNEINKYQQQLQQQQQQKQQSTWRAPVQPNNTNNIHNPNINQQYIYTNEKSPKGLVSDKELGSQYGLISKGKENGISHKADLEDHGVGRGSAKKEAVASTKTLKKNHSANNLNSAGLMGRKYSASGEIKYNGTARVSSYSKLQNPDHVHQSGNSKSNSKDPSLKNLVSSEIKKSLAKKKSGATLISQNLNQHSSTSKLCQQILSGAQQQSHLNVYGQLNQHSNSNQNTNANPNSGHNHNHHQESLFSKKKAPENLRCQKPKKTGGSTHGKSAVSARTNYSNSSWKSAHNA